MVDGVVCESVCGCDSVCRSGCRCGNATMDRIPSGVMMPITGFSVLDSDIYRLPLYCWNISQVLGDITYNNELNV